MSRAVTTSVNVDNGDRDSDGDVLVSFVRHFAEAFEETLPGIEKSQ